MLEKQQLLTPFVTQRIKVLDHDAALAANLMQLGETERGTPIEINRALRDFLTSSSRVGLVFITLLDSQGVASQFAPGWLRPARLLQLTCWPSTLRTAADKRE